MRRGRQPRDSVRGSFELQSKWECSSPARREAGWAAVCSTYGPARAAGEERAGASRPSVKGNRPRVWRWTSDQLVPETLHQAGVRDLFDDRPSFNTTIRAAPTTRREPERMENGVRPLIRSGRESVCTSAFPTAASRAWWLSGVSTGGITGAASGDRDPLPPSGGSRLPALARPACVPYGQPTLDELGRRSTTWRKSRKISRTRAVRKGVGDVRTQAPSEEQRSETDPEMVGRRRLLSSPRGRSCRRDPPAP